METKVSDDDFRADYRMTNTGLAVIFSLKFE